MTTMTPIVSDTTHKTGAELIAAERQRQIEMEGWMHDHDDHHKKGELAQAGASYAITGALQSEHGRLPQCFIPKQWPFERVWYKPAIDPVVNLTKAGALIAAEIDRLQRLRDPEPIHCYDSPH